MEQFIVRTDTNFKACSLTINQMAAIVRRKWQMDQPLQVLLKMVKRMVSVFSNFLMEMSTRGNSKTIISMAWASLL